MEHGQKMCLAGGGNKGEGGNAITVGDETIHGGYKSVYTNMGDESCDWRWSPAIDRAG